MKPRMVKPNGKGDGLAELEADITIRFEQGEELAAQHAKERLELEVQQRDRLLKLANQHATELTEMEARQLEEVAALWRKQGRKLGPWAGRDHWRGEHGKNGRHHGTQR